MGARDMSATVGLREHFSKLIDFGGREDRASFWPYAALVYGLMTVVSVAVMFAVMRSFMPGANDITADVSTSTFLDMGMFFVGMMILTAVLILLYAAAVARRLHDAGLSGFWGLMPLPFLLFSMVRTRDLFSSFASNQPDMDRFSQIFISNLIYILTIIALIVLLSRRSDPMPNRYDTGPKA